MEFVFPEYKEIIKLFNCKPLALNYEEGKKALYI